MSRRSWTAIAVVSTMFAIAYVASPFWAAWQFRNAALSADVDGLRDAVDFPAVRESLKPQVTAVLVNGMRDAPEIRDNPFAGLALLAAPAIVGGMIDSLVTPESLSALMKRGRLERGRLAGAGSPPKAADVEYDFDYRSLDQFATAVRRPGASGSEASLFVFERRGLFSWKMVRLEIPVGQLANRNGAPDRLRQ